MSDEKVSYIISFSHKEIPPRNITEGDSLDVGSGALNVVKVEDLGLAQEHCVFTLKDGVLSIKNLAGDDQTIYEGEALLKGKNYILDDGEEVKLANLYRQFKQTGSLDSYQYVELRNFRKERADPIKTASRS